VAVVCSTCGATRIGFRFDDQGHKIRVCKKCGTDL
jgi:ribosomal protein L24